MHDLDDDELDELVRLCQALRGHRWPYQPLGDVLGGTMKEQAARVGVHDRQITRWRQIGLTDEMADRSALRAGLHPALVWPGWDDVDGRLEEVA